VDRRALGEDVGIENVSPVVRWTLTIATSANIASKAWAISSSQ
jgi:hypothetical protein